MTKEENNFGCKTHPDAPHGFVRNASHSEDRYVCECEFWEPPEQDEPVGVVGMDVSRPHLRSLDGQYLGQKPDTKTVMLFKDLEVGTNLYTTPQQRKPLTDEQIGKMYNMHLQNGGPIQRFARAIESAHGIGVST